MHSNPPVHLFGTSVGTGAWAQTPIAASYRYRVPTADDLTKVLGGGGPAVVALADRIAPAALREVEPGAGITVVISDPAAATGGRGSAELIAKIWRLAPSVALLLGEHLLEVGAVVFVGNGVPAKAGDAITSAAVTAVRQGASLKALLVGTAPGSTAPAAPPELTPAADPERRWLADLIGDFEGRQLLGQVGSHADSVAVRSGLLLWHDFLDESHALSQSIEGEGRNRAGDYWHAIMHRREPDYHNAKYWFRRVGRQAVFESLAARAPRVVADGGEAGRRLISRIVPNGIWDPFAFVDSCAEAERSGDAATSLLLRRLQSDEMLLLLAQTVRDALA